MILVFIFLFIFIGLINSLITINIENFNLKNFSGDFDAKYSIKIKLKLYNIIPVFSISLKNDKANIMGIKIDIKKFKEIFNMKNRILKAKNNFKLSSIKYLKPNIENINLKLSLGTGSIFITSFLVPFISTILSFFIKKTIKKFDEKKYRYIIKPEFEDKTKVYLQLNAIFNIKLTNIIECLKYNYEVIK